MKRNLPRLLLVAILVAGLDPQLSTLFAQVPETLSYQGRVTVSGTNFTGTGQFKFALVDPGTNTARRATATASVNAGVVASILVTDGGAGYTVAPAVTITDPTGTGATAVAVVAGGAVVAVNLVNNGTGYSVSPRVTIAPPPAAMLHVTYWSHDGTSVAGGPPTSVVSLPVSGGLFTAILGDTNVANMQPMPPTAFGSPQTRLRIWFNDGVNGFVQLVPDQPVTSVAYAMVAAGLTGTQAQTFTGPVAFNPSSGAPFSVNGSVKVGELNVDLLDGLDSTAFWQLGGNAGTAAGKDFLGTTDNQPLEFKVNNQRALRIELSGAGPANLIGGAAASLFAPGTVGGFIGGGTGNLSGGNYSAIVGGAGGSIAVGSDYGTIGGGLGNSINSNSRCSSIGGGHENIVGEYSGCSFIGGGTNNSVASNSLAAVIGGGQQNVVGANAIWSVIGGGLFNSIEANVESGTIAGGRNNVIGTNSYRSTIGGGHGNTVGADSTYASIVGGVFNDIGANADYSAIGGGYDNGIGTNSDVSTIGGGNLNTIGNDSGSSTIAGGNRNKILTNAFFSTIGGGWANTIYANANYATIPGGEGNSARSYAFAAGRNARATNQGAFVWSDSTVTAIGSTNDNSVTMRASGGYRFFTGTGTAGAQLPAGATAWIALSDRNLKKDIRPVDCQVILDKLSSVPVTQWHYEWEESSAPLNLGPMAQDFKAIFYPGRDDTGISTLEFDGVALAAIQGLNQKLESDSAALRAENRELKARLDKLERLINARNGGGQ